jgi:hypothetical protein
VGEVAFRVQSLHLYPIRSCAGAEVRQALLIETGLELDRAWMVVDASGEALGGPAWPQLARVKPALRTDDMVLRAPGMLALHVALDAVEEPTFVRLHGAGSPPTTWARSAPNGSATISGSGCGWRGSTGTGVRARIRGCGR